MRAVTPRIACVALCASVLLGACESTPPIYRWSEYEAVVYEAWKSPGGADPVAAAERLAEDLRRTEAEGAQAPPGAHAHLGHLLLEGGDAAGAAAQFRAERDRFPESAALMDTLLDRLGASRS